MGIPKIFGFEAVDGRRTTCRSTLVVNPFHQCIVQGIDDVGLLVLSCLVDVPLLNHSAKLVHVDETVSRLARAL
jgi:hypothetical protein